MVGSGHRSHCDLAGDTRSADSRCGSRRGSCGEEALVVGATVVVTAADGALVAAVVAGTVVVAGDAGDRAGS